MINFKNLNQETPFLIFKDKFDEARYANQSNIDAISISSYSLKNKEVNSRYVNLKFVIDKEFIFFSNYHSPKAHDFNSHNQISALIYWDKIDVQIRMKAKIKQTTKEFNFEYFSKRDDKKNALSISSKQSATIESYENVYKKYKHAFKSENLQECPDNWGGFSFVPYYFEFWKGHNSRLNKRESYELQNEKWIHSFLQP